MEDYPDFIKVVLIDADIVAYRCAAVTKEEPVSACLDNVDSLMDRVSYKALTFDGTVKSYITGKDNFRYELAKSAPYKGNRVATEKPAHLDAAREHLMEYWDTTLSYGEEADDMIATESTRHDPKSTAIASNDKDFNTVPGWKFNFVKNTWRYDTKFTALQYFYNQVLTGDSADNIIGLYRVGIKTAEKMLVDCVTEEDMWKVAVEAYDGDTERVIENARLLHLRRYEGEIWEPPEYD